ncbi:energy-coupling factor ABC transporter ATP-binding protein (plasmid) [Streptomyces sp. NBC_01591]|uniref:energy-coupling factor ABC transporter ATP-binding protein n=1 Tax=Streptomyces sp. NBC_01591 TaxID=2975888 RepID=UPI002DD7D47E|nr:ABC transporter ATP-binding protein [Streptomyces sp. NBC_01591]WSD74030.1 energy-coupling factor ABC transporter ATP-binding protein [Streptomyces sp. NBC_01591]
MTIRVEDLVYRYPNGALALDRVSVTIDPGERVAIVGSNGAGKSTFARHLIGIARPSSGSVWLDDWNTADHSVAELARKVGYVFQNPHDQLHARSVEAEVRFGPRNLGFSAGRTAELVAWAMEAMGLTQLAAAHPHHLSLGDRKRVTLASVLAMDSAVVVLDEPTTGQDHRSVEAIGGLVSELAGRGKTVLAITHDMDFCAENFDRVLVMAEGRIHLDVPTTDWLGPDRELERYGLEPPQITRLARGLDWPEPVATVGQFMERLPGYVGSAD